jgi:PIN domain nuclease of toxin-antitoxin system
MRVLIDTHVFIWWTGASNQLSPLVRDTLTDPQTEAMGCVSLSKKENHTNRSRLVIATGK